LSAADHRRHRSGAARCQPEATLAVADKVLPGFGEADARGQPALRADRDPVAPVGVTREAV